VKRRDGAIAELRKARPRRRRGCARFGRQDEKSCEVRDGGIRGRILPADGLLPRQEGACAAAVPEGALGAASRCRVGFPDWGEGGRMGVWLM